MAKKDIVKNKVKISVPPPPDSTIKQIDDVFIVMTEAYCPNGHNLISDDNEEFDEYPGIKVYLKGEKKEGPVYLSPFQGDGTKKGTQDWNAGEKLKFFCPECNEALPIMAHCSCLDNKGEHGDIVKIFTSDDLAEKSVLSLCNVWGCRKSKVTDNWNIISEYLDGEIID
ncbi:MAG: hypothetical protein JXR91_11775 [Deltaproteobacteria bacterium]|nr:hypothetical protein [Deltaproteobacteria bacterium]